MRFAIKIHLPQYDKCQQQNQSEKKILIMNENAGIAERPVQAQMQQTRRTGSETKGRTGRRMHRQGRQAGETDAGHVAKSSSTTAHFINFGSEQLQL